MSRIRGIVLGCGSSGGVPRIGGPEGGGDWGACDPENPKNRRRRCSMLFEVSRDDAFARDAVTAVLVDTAPDLREQLIEARVKRLDAVLITHDHADQTHGVDDLRVVAMQMKARVPVYVDGHTAPDFVERFAYCFRQKPGSLYPPILELRETPQVGTTFEIKGPGGLAPVAAFLQGHGPVDSLGFRIGPFAYSSDVADLSEESFEILDGVDIWVVDALRYTPHKTHAHLDRTLS
ncbi:MAG: MBL fold metallo-hydrolase, partial [Pseudomonadota bacterium]